MKKLEAIIPPVVKYDDQGYYCKDIDSSIVYKKDIEDELSLFLIKSLEYDSAEDNVFLCGVNLETKERSKISVADFVYFDLCSFFKEKDEELIAKELGTFAGYVYNKEHDKNKGQENEFVSRIKTQMKTLSLAFMHWEEKNNLNTYFDESFGIEVNNHMSMDRTIPKDKSFVKTDLIFNNNKEDNSKAEGTVESLEPILE